MLKTFKIGEYVRWTSVAGRVSGIIIKKITSDMKFKGYPNSIWFTLRCDFYHRPSNAPMRFCQ